MFWIRMRRVSGCKFLVPIYSLQNSPTSFTHHSFHPLYLSSTKFFTHHIFHRPHLPPTIFYTHHIFHLPQLSPTIFSPTTSFNHHIFHSPLNFGFKWVQGTYQFDKLCDNFSNFQLSMSKLVNQFISIRISASNGLRMPTQENSLILFRKTS